MLTGFSDIHIIRTAKGPVTFVVECIDLDLVIKVFNEVGQFYAGRGVGNRHLLVVGGVLLDLS